MESFVSGLVGPLLKNIAKDVGLKLDEKLSGPTAYSYCSTVKLHRDFRFFARRKACLVSTRICSNSYRFSISIRRTIVFSVLLLLDDHSVYKYC